MHVDFDENQRFPDLFKSLTIVLLIDESHDLRQCSSCGAYFDCFWKDDNDIFSPLHTGEYFRITKQKAESIIEENKKDAESNKSKKTKKRKPKL